MLKDNKQNKSLDAYNIYMREVSIEGLLTAEEEIKFGRMVKKGYNGARNKMISKNLRLVVSIARRYTYRGVALDDLVEDGNIGLILAVDRFDPELGFRFSTYATWWIRQAIERGVMNNRSNVRLPIHIAKNLNLIAKAVKEIEAETNEKATVKQIKNLTEFSSEVIEKLLEIKSTIYVRDNDTDDDDGVSVIQNIIDEDANILSKIQEDKASNIIKSILNKMDDKEKMVIECRYGLNNTENMTLDEIGHILQLSRERIRQIEKQALKNFRRIINKLGYSLHDLIYNMK